MATRMENLTLQKIVIKPLDKCKKLGQRQEQFRLQNAHRRPTEMDNWVNQLNVLQLQYTFWRIFGSKKGKMKKISLKSLEKLIKKMANPDIYEYRLDHTKGLNGIMPFFHNGILIGVILYFAAGYVNGISDRIDNCWEYIYFYLTGEEDPDPPEIEEFDPEKPPSVYVYSVDRITKAVYARRTDKLNKNYGPFIELYKILYKPKIVLEEDFFKFPAHLHQQIREFYYPLKETLKQISDSENAFELDNFDSFESVPVPEVRPTTSAGSGRPSTSAIAAQMPRPHLLENVFRFAEVINQTTLVRQHNASLPPKVGHESMPNQGQDLTKLRSVRTDPATFDCTVQSKSISSTSTSTAKCSESNAALLKIKKDRVLQGLKRKENETSDPKTLNKKSCKSSGPLILKLRKSVQGQFTSKIKPKANLVQQKKIPAQAETDDLVKTIQPDHQVTELSISANTQPEPDNLGGNTDNHHTGQFGTVSNSGMVCSNGPLTLDEIVKTIQSNYQFTKPADLEDRGCNLANQSTDQFSSCSNREMVSFNDTLEDEIAVGYLIADINTQNSSVEDSVAIREKELPSRTFEFADPSPFMAQSPVTIPHLEDNVSNEPCQSVATRAIENSVEQVNDPVKCVTPCPSVGKCLDRNGQIRKPSLADNDHIVHQQEDVPLINQPITSAVAPLMINPENDILIKNLEDLVESLDYNDEPASDLAIPKDQNQVCQNIGNPDSNGPMSHAQTIRTVQTQADSIPIVQSGPLDGFKRILEPEAAAALMNYNQTWNANPPVSLGIHGPCQRLSLTQNSWPIPANSGQQVWPGNWNSFANANSGFMQGSSQPLGLAQTPVQATIPLGVTSFQNGLNMTTNSNRDHSGQQVWPGYQNSFSNSGLMHGSSQPLSFDPNVHQNCTVQPQMGAPLMHNPLHAYRRIAPKPKKKHQPKHHSVRPVKNPSAGEHLGGHNNVQWQSGPSSSFAEHNRVQPTYSMFPLTMAQRQNPMIGNYYNHPGMNGPGLAHAGHNRFEQDDATLIKNIESGVFGLAALEVHKAIAKEYNTLLYKTQWGPGGETDSIEFKRINKIQKAFMSKLKSGDFDPTSNVEHNRNILMEAYARLGQMAGVSSSNVGQPMNNSINGDNMFYGPYGQMNPGQSAVPPMGLHYPIMNASGMMMYPNRQNAHAAAAVHHPSLM